MCDNQPRSTLLGVQRENQEGNTRRKKTRTLFPFPPLACGKNYMSVVEKNPFSRSAPLPFLPPLFPPPTPFSPASLLISSAPPFFSSCSCSSFSFCFSFSSSSFSQSNAPRRIKRTVSSRRNSNPSTTFPPLSKLLSYRLKPIKTETLDLFRLSSS